MIKKLLFIIVFLFVSQYKYSQIIIYVDEMDSSFCFTLKNNIDDTV